MQTQHRSKAVTILVIIGALPCLATDALHAQKPTRRPKAHQQPAKPSQPDPGAARRARIAKAKAKSGVGRRPFRPRLIVTAVHQYKNLQRAVRENIQMDDEQAQRVDRLFEDLYEQLETGAPGARWILDPRDDDALRIGPKSVRLHGGRDAEQLKRMGGVRGLLPVITPVTPRRVFVERLTEEFYGEQVKQLTRVLRRWEVLQVPMGMRDDPVKRVRRSIQDPKIGLSDSETEAFKVMIDKRLRELIRTRADQETFAAVAEELRSEILQKLTPDQQKQFLTTHQELVEDAKRLDKKIEKAEAQAKAEAQERIKARKAEDDGKSSDAEKAKPAEAKPE